ncbi:type II toxin-antitoxin system RelE/ParE family toxin [Mucilaginibacter boryungensis]|uniref:Type II toxin-antitoxin system RelE/ParE family toxin n=1 Tax=Mucilaginibacter boryungensis TaxID=768480 RepID=A0ABR9XNQ3_9SPHI|nr:type II toxin-antitoxin system RelE/ParE family toxin [Mucilaginibacter boryungensis]
MAKRLIVSRKAYLNIDYIIEFNNTRNQSNTYSIKFVKQIFKEFNVLTKHPFLGKPTRNNSYVLIWRDYCIYYLIENDRIIILSVNHQKQNIR